MNTPSLNIFVFAIFYTFITAIHAVNFTVVHQYPNKTITIDTHDFEIKIDRNVNPPNFTSLIHFYKVNNDALIGAIDVSLSTTNRTYANGTLTFHKPENITWNTSSEYYITFDAGVLFSNNTLNSTARDDTNFWRFEVVHNNSVTHESSTTEPFTSASNTGVSNGESDTSTSPALKRGESPPTRSAQLGMGLGISFIAVLLIGEIIYYKYFYRGGRQGGYAA